MYDNFKNIYQNTRRISSKIVCLRFFQVYVGENDLFQTVNKLSITLHVMRDLIPFIGSSNTNCVSAYTIRRKNYFYDRIENLIHYIDSMSAKFFISLKLIFTEM